MTNDERYNVQVTRSRWYFGSKLPKTRDVTWHLMTPNIDRSI